MRSGRIRPSTLIKLTSILFLLAIGVSIEQTAARADLKPGDFEQFMSHGGRNRSYILHIPPGCSDTKPVPLVIVLHGGGGNAAGASRMTGMSAKSDKERFIAVYPNGTGFFTDSVLTWNAGNCCGYALDHKVDDVGFIRALIKRLESDFRIDPARIYVTGISNGAMLAHRVACELSDKIAAIAPVAGALNCASKPKKPVSVIIFHGTADKHVLYEGGHPIKRMDSRDRVDKPVSYAVSFWVNHDGCSTPPVKTEKGSIVSETYSGGKDGTEVVLYTINGGGHAWPGRTRFLAGADQPTREISATDIIWSFFARHPKRLRNPMTCPKCGTEKNTIPIVYGLPDEKLIERSNRGEVKIGGCIVTGHDPKWYCKSCKSKW